MRLLRIILETHKYKLSYHISIRLFSFFYVQQICVFSGQFSETASLITVCCSSQPLNVCLFFFLLPFDLFSFQKLNTTESMCLHIAFTNCVPGSSAETQHIWYRTDPLNQCKATLYSLCESPEAPKFWTCHKIVTDIHTHCIYICTYISIHNNIVGTMHKQK